MAWTGRNLPAQDVHTIHLRTLSKIFSLAACFQPAPRDLSSRVSRPFYIAFRGRQHLCMKLEKGARTTKWRRTMRGPRMIRLALFLASISRARTAAMRQAGPRRHRIRRRPVLHGQNCACPPAARPRSRRGRCVAHPPPPRHRYARRVPSLSDCPRSCCLQGLPP